MGDFSGVLLSPAKLRRIRPQIACEREEFRTLLAPHFRVDELDDGRALWTHRDPKLDGHYASVWPDAAALMAWITKPPEPRIYGPITIARSLGIGPENLTPDAIAARRDALAEALGVPPERLDFARASLALLRRGRDGRRLLWPGETLQAQLLLYFGETVRRAVNGEWSVVSTPHGVNMGVRAPSGAELQVFGEVTDLWDEGQNPEWGRIFESLMREAVTSNPDASS